MEVNILYTELREALLPLYGSTESDNIAKYYFEDAFDITSFDRKLNDADLLRFEKDKKRLVDGEPLQYVVGVAHFYGYKFNVSKDVLIPRPETEELVHQTIKVLKTKKGPVSILDIGCGSACIPVTIKKECFSQAKLTAIDVSSDALQVAISNSFKLDAPVKFRCIDFLKESGWGDMGKFDIIVSNPPYIPFKEKSILHRNVLDHEPHVALFVKDENPLLFYKKIILFARERLLGNGSILTEVNEFNAKEVKHLFVNFGYPNAHIIKDMQGKDRIVSSGV